MSLFRRLCTAVLALSLWVGQPAAGEPAALTLVSYSDYAPYISESLPGGGMLTEIVRAAYATQETQLKLINIPWKRGYRMVQEGEAVGTFPWPTTEAREQDFLVSSALFGDTNFVFTTLPDYNKLSDLIARHARGERSVICIPLGWTVPLKFVPLVEKNIVTRVTPEKISSCLDLMHSGRSQILNIPPLTVFYELNELQKRLNAEEPPISGLRMIDPGVSAPSTAHILFARTANGAAAADVFNQGLKAIVADGSYSRIVARHLALYPGIDTKRVYEDLRTLRLIAPTPTQP